MTARLPRARLERRRPPREPAGGDRGPVDARRGRARVLVGVRDRAGRRGARPARLLQRVRADRDAAGAGGAARRLQGGRARARAASRAACATARARSTSTCCCSRASSTSPSGCGSRTARSPRGGSCSCRCSSSIPTSRCTGGGRAADALAALGPGPGGAPGGSAAGRARVRRRWSCWRCSRSGAARADAATFCVDASAPGVRGQAEPRRGARPRPRTSRAPTRSGSGAAPRRARSPTPAASRCGSSARAARRPCSRARSTSARTSPRSRRWRCARRARRRSRCAAPATACGVDGDVRLRDGAALRSSVVTGPVTTAGDVAAHSVLIAGPGVDVESGALTARHLTVYGAGAVGVRIAPGALATVARLDRVGVRGAFSGSFAATRSDYPGAAGAVDPGFADPPADLGLRRRLAARRRRRPGAARRRRAARGRRRRGARDRRRTATARRAATSARSSAGRRRRPRTRGNLLANPGAEQGTAATDDTASPAPPRWTRTGAFTSVRYGTVAGPFAFPPLDAAARAAGRRRVLRRPGPAARRASRQVVDVSRWAPEIDARAGARVRLSALLGGFRRSEDRAIVSAEFRGPTGARRGGFALDTVTRGRARPTRRCSPPALAERRLPRLTRTIAVTVRAAAPGGSYNDAYADDVALVPRVPRLPGVAPARQRAPAVRRRAAAVAAGAGGPARPRARAASGARARRSGSAAASSRSPACAPSCSARCASRCGRGRSGACASRSRGARGASLARRRTAGHVYAAARDGQGLTRTAVAPVRIVRR